MKPHQTNRQALMNSSSSSNNQSIGMRDFKKSTPLTKKLSVGSKVDEAVIKERILKRHSSKGVSSSQRATSKEENMKRSEAKFGATPVLDILLGRYTPKIVNTLAFTRSDLPMNKVFLKNKYAHLF